MLELPSYLIEGYFESIGMHMTRVRGDIIGLLISFQSKLFRNVFRSVYFFYLHNVSVDWTFFANCCVDKNLSLSSFHRHSVFDFISEFSCITLLNGFSSSSCEWVRMFAVLISAWIQLSMLIEIYSRELGNSVPFYLCWFMFSSALNNGYATLSDSGSNICSRLLCFVDFPSI